MRIFVRAILVACVLSMASACVPSAADQGVSTRPVDTATPSAIPSATPFRPATITPSATPAPACALEGGRVERTHYASPVAGAEVSALVYLPACYEASGGPYPVMYLLHGKPFDETHWVTLGVVSAVESGVATGEWPPFLMVMPRLPEPLFSSSDGGTGSYEQEMLEVLVPFIDATYRTAQVPQGRALAGISRGGVWALEIGLRNPHVFGGVAALSPALAVNRPRPAYDPFEIVAASEDLPPQIYLAAGETDWALRDTLRLATALEAHGLVSRLDIFPGAHDAEVWQAALEPMLSYLTLSWAAQESGLLRPATAAAALAPPSLR